MITPESKWKEEDLKSALLHILTDNTTKKEILVLLKLALDSGKRITYGSLLAKDEMYHMQKEELDRAVLEYEGTEFTKEQKEVVEELLAKKDEVNYEANLIAYSAGILDGYQLLKTLGITNE